MIRSPFSNAVMADKCREASGRQPLSTSMKPHQVPLPILQQQQSARDVSVSRQRQTTCYHNPRRDTNSHAPRRDRLPAASSSTEGIFRDGGREAHTRHAALWRRSDIFLANLCMLSSSFSTPAHFLCVEASGVLPPCKRPRRVFWFMKNMCMIF